MDPLNLRPLMIRSSNSASIERIDQNFENSDPDLRGEGLLGSGRRRMERTGAPIPRILDLSMHPTPWNLFPRIERRSFQRNLFPRPETSSFRLNETKNTSLVYLLRKELKKSDVGPLGRIVLPKREAEAYLPILTARDGIHMKMLDMDSYDVWHFKYWPNNRTRMYILENTREFVRVHNLQADDTVVFYRDEFNLKYVIQAKKAVRVTLPREEPGVPGAQVIELAYLNNENVPFTEEMNEEMNAEGIDNTLSLDFPIDLENGTMENYPLLEPISSFDPVENLPFNDFS
ncbi:uncharacterized protein LOC143886883 isoform X2 [Tasmannia lanceolata]|uniref:uncharacterized protein LOC143886883 isoform X2 n=1 Tax=Tasmannia lanceolata TaxID=3420 RepID=UPI0040631125